MSGRSDSEWDRYGGMDPYYGVLAEKQFSRGNLREKELEEFFRTGTEHVDRVLATVSSAFPDAPRKRALDFGCGVGRLVVPLAGRFSEVVGLDVSPNMLAESRKNCEARGIRNADLVLSDDALSRLSGRFSFIHSFIVFQHIRPRRGLEIFSRLLDVLEPGGAGAVHFCYTIRGPRLEAFKRKTLRTFPWIHPAVNVLKGRPFRYPLMEMNEYDAEAILALLQEKGFKRVVVEFTDQIGHLGLMVYFQRDPSPARPDA